MYIHRELLQLCKCFLILLQCYCLCDEHFWQITIQQNTDDALHIAEVQFFYKNQQLSRAAFIFTASSYMSAIDIGRSISGPPEAANDDNINTFFHSAYDDHVVGYKGKCCPDPSPTLIINTNQNISFDRITIINRQDLDDSGKNFFGRLIGATVTVHDRSNTVVLVRQITYALSTYFIDMPKDKATLCSTDKDGSLGAAGNVSSISCRSDMPTYQCLLHRCIPNLSLYEEDDQPLPPPSSREVMPVGYSTERNFLNSILGAGFAEKFHALKEKLERKEKVSILAFGGSITAGGGSGGDSSTGDNSGSRSRSGNSSSSGGGDSSSSSSSSRSGSGGKGAASSKVGSAWPEYLQRFYRNIGWENIFVSSNAVRASSSRNLFIDRIPTYKATKGHPINKADIIIYETSGSDMMGLLHDDSGHSQRVNMKVVDTIAQETEIVIRQFLSLPKQPIVVILEVSGRHEWLPSPAVYSHQQVALQYGIPQLSMTHLFSGADFSDTLRDWATKIYRSDGYHVTEFGQKLVAATVMRFLNLLLCDQWGTLNTMDRKEFRIISDPPFLSTVEYSRMYELGQPIYISWSSFKDYLALPTSFEDNFDRRHHYIASKGNDTHSSIIFRLKKESVKFGLVVVEYVKSNTRMGSFSISVFNELQPPQPDNKVVSRECSAHFPSQRPIASYLVDARWANKVTLSATARVFFNVTETGTTAQSELLYLCIEVVPVLPPRSSNEVWLTGVVVY